MGRTPGHGKTTGGTAVWVFWCFCFGGVDVCGVFFFFGSRPQQWDWYGLMLYAIRISFLKNSRHVFWGSPKVAFVGRWVGGKKWEKVKTRQKKLNTSLEFRISAP